MAHFFAAAALFRSRSSGANRRLTSSAEKASGSKSSPSRARPKTYGFCFLRDPFIGIPREPFYLWPLSTPFRPGSEHQYYAPAGVLSRSSGILFNVKPNGDWLAVRYNDTENNMALWEFHYGNCKPDQIQGPIQTLYARSKCVARVENEGERF